MSNISKSTLQTHKNNTPLTDGPDNKHLESAVADIRIKMGFLNGKFDYLMDRINSIEKRMEESQKKEHIPKELSPRPRYKFIKVESIPHGDLKENDDTNEKTAGTERTGSRRSLKH